VSCTSAGSCSAVGTYTDNNGNNHLYAENWNGKNWPAAPTSGPKDAEFNDAVCLSAANCTGAGFYWPGGDGTIQSLIWSWNGKSWSRVSTPSPSKSEPNQLMGADCSSAQACTAVGLIAPSGTNNSKNLIESGSSGR
jgi:hypothetical protein